DIGVRSSDVCSSDLVLGDVELLVTVRLTRRPSHTIDVDTDARSTSPSPSGQAVTSADRSSSGSPAPIAALVVCRSNDRVGAQPRSEERRVGKGGARG